MSVTCVSIRARWTIICTQLCLLAQILKLPSKLFYSIAASRPFLGVPNHYSSPSLRQAHAIVSVNMKQTFFI